MFESILVPVDGSSPSSNALNVAIDLAKKYEAKLSIVHAIQPYVSIEALREVADRYGFLDQVTEDLADPNIITSVAAPGTGVPIVIIPDAVLEKIGNLLLEKISLQNGYSVYPCFPFFCTSIPSLETMALIFPV